MKRVQVPFIVCCLLLALLGCKKSDFSFKADIDDNTSENQLKAFLKTNALSDKGMQETEDHYVVEGDIIISKAELKKMSLTIPRQASTNNTIQNNLTNITIGLEGGYDSRWFYIIQDAVAAWNAISDCRVNLIHKYDNLYSPYSGLSVDILVRKDAGLGTGNFGRGAWPTISGSPGGLILVNHVTNNVYQSGPNRGQDNGIPRTHLQHVYMLVHEIGHCLGLRHTDWAWEGTGSMGANPIPGTPSTGYQTDDATSVMNSGDMGTDYAWVTWPFDARFSTYDRTAARYLYPVVTTPYITTFKNFINGESSASTGSTIISTAGAGGYSNYEWRILDIYGNNLGDPAGSNGQQIEWGYATPGTYTLQCRVVGAECPGEWASQIISLY